MAPGDRHALRVEARGEAVVVVRPVHVVLDVLLAAPHDLDRVFGLLGNQRCLDDEVELEPSPEAAAQQVIVNAHLLNLQSERLCHGLLRDGGDLRADPDVAAVGRHLHGAIDWLHGRMREERRLVDGFDLRRGACQRRDHVALVLGDCTGRLRGLCQRGHHVGRGKRGVRPIVERSGAGLKTCPRSPVVIRDHGNGIVEFYHLMHTRHFQRRGVVEGGERAAEHRRGRDGRNLHVRQFHVDAVDRRAVDLASDIQPLGRRADDAEGARILKLDVGGGRELRRCIG